MLIGEFVENNGNGGLTGQPHRAKLAIQRLNAIHDQYGDLILYRDMLYVLSVFLVTPCEFCDTRWSTRTMSPKEKEYIFHHWMEIGRQMYLDVDQEWTCYEDCQAFKKHYERVYLVYAPENYDVMLSTVNYFVQTLPSCIQPGIRSIVLSIIAGMQSTPKHCKALGLSLPSYHFTFLLDFILTSRAILHRYFFFPIARWSNRLTAFQQVVQTTTTTNLNNGCCPFALYHPARPLDFGNNTYTIASSRALGESNEEVKAYAIETLGPRSCPKGLLCAQPRYAERNVMKGQQQQQQ